MDELLRDTCPMCYYADARCVPGDLYYISFNPMDIDSVLRYRYMFLISGPGTDCSQQPAASEYWVVFAST